jgi:glycosyltransferase involved in cell wall biosynthesis
VRRVKVGPSAIKPLLDLLLWLKALAMLSTERYGIIHAHEEAAYFSLPLAALFDIKLLYDMHSSLPQQLSNYGFANYRPLVRLFSRIEAAVVRRADAIITICSDLQRQVHRLGGGQKAFLIENTAVEQPPASTDPLVARLRRELQAEGRWLVVYTGTFERNQGLDLLVRGAARVVVDFPQTIYLLVGGRPDQVERLRSLARSEGVTEHFLFPGTRPVEEIPVYLQAADVLVSPRPEGTNTPLKIYSYLAAGKPIVASDLKTHRQVLDEQTAQLVAPTPEGLAQGICLLLGDPARRDLLGRNARRLMDERYSYQAYLTRTRSALAHLGAG